MKFTGFLFLVVVFFICGCSQQQKQKTFTILHTNDLHSSFIGMGPSSDYTPFELNNDKTVGGYARLAGLITQKKELHSKQGAVLALDAGDYSMGTPFGAATRVIGGELQLMSRMGYDATTFGNHEFDLGVSGIVEELMVAAKSGFTIPVIASNAVLTAKDTTLLSLQKMAGEGHILPYKLIERDGIRFGIIGLLGYEATFYTSGAGALKFAEYVYRYRCRHYFGQPGNRCLPPGNSCRYWFYSKWNDACRFDAWEYGYSNCIRHLCSSPAWFRRG